MYSLAELQHKNHSCCTGYEKTKNSWQSILETETKDYKAVV